LGGDANVDLYENGVISTSASIPAGTMQTISEDVPNGQTVRIESDVPVLVSHYTSEGNDGYNFYPASTEWYGTPSQMLEIGAGPQATHVDIYYHDGTSASLDLPANGEYERDTNSNNGNAVGTRVVADYPIGVHQAADSDGGEATTFLPKSEFETEFYLPLESDYAAIVSDQPFACNVNGGAASSAVGGPVPYPYKLRYGDSDLVAGDKITCDAPVQIYYEQASNNQETNLWGIKQSRQYVYPEPSYVAGVEEDAPVIGDGQCDPGETCENSPDDCTIDYTDCHTCGDDGDCYHEDWGMYYSNYQECCGLENDFCGTESMSLFKCSAGTWDCDTGYTDCDGGSKECRCYTGDETGKTECDATQIDFSECCGQVVIVDEISGDLVITQNNYWTTDGPGADKCCSSSTACVDNTGTCRLGTEGGGYANCGDGIDNDCDATELNNGIDCNDVDCADSIYCAPQFSSFSYESDVDTFNINWDIDYTGSDSITVNCVLNSVPAESCDYTGPPGTGGCFIDTPVYLTTQDGTLPRSVSNEISCTAEDFYDSGISSVETANFYPIEFEVTIPSQMSVVVGERTTVAITVKNKGTLDDSYSVTVTAENPEIIRIETGTQSTEVLQTNYAQQVYEYVTLLSSEETANVNIVVGSESYTGITYDPEGATDIIVRGTYKSLPEFGFLGLLQIMIFASVIFASLLFERTKNYNTVKNNTNNMGS